MRHFVIKHGPIARKLPGFFTVAHKEQQGWALPLVLVMLLLGGLIIAPLLAFMGTGLKSGMLFEDKTQEVYAADAGVQHAMYEIVYDDCSQVVSPSAYDEYDFSTTYQYQLIEEVNEKAVNVALQNIWVPSNIDPPTPSQAQGIIDAETLKIQSTYSGEATCRTRIEWYDDCGLDLKVKNIGIWLSSGFSYVPGSSNLEDDPMAACYPSFVDLQDHMGGQAVIFRFSPAVNFFDLPDLDGDGDYHSVIIDIDYYSPDGAVPMFVSWVDTRDTRHHLCLG
jgi:hypothetical protein